MTLVSRAFLWDVEAALKELTAGKNWTPTVYQNANIAATVNYATYRRVGQLVVVQVSLTVTGTGTAGNDLAVKGFPSQMRLGAGANLICGIAELRDLSTTTLYQCSVAVTTDNEFYFNYNVAAQQRYGTNPSIAVDNTDTIRFTAVYPGS